MIVQKAQSPSPSANANLSPRSLWGKVIVHLREKGLVALHIACGDISDVEKKDDIFYINTTEDMLYEILQNEDNLKSLKDALLLFGINEFKVVKKEKVESKQKQDIKILKEIFGDKLYIE